MSPLQWCFSILLAFTLLFSHNNAQAGINGSIINDFAPLSGYVIQPAGKEFIIDLDARQQIAVGDLFSVVTPGEKIIHPVTKQLLGTQDSVKGIIQVTAVKAGFSYARPLGSASTIKNGDVIRRFQNIDIDFWDYTGNGRSYFMELQQKLTHLQWRGYDASQRIRPDSPKALAGANTAMYFILTNQALEVRSPDFAPLRSYPVADMPKGAVVPAAVPAPAITDANASAPIQQVKESDMGMLWTSPSMTGVPVGIETGDFDGDGKVETAIAFEDRVEIYRLINGNMLKQAEARLDVSLKLYHLDGIDLNRNGRMELFVSAVSASGNLSAFVIENEKGQYRITSKEIPWHLRAVMMPGEGTVLLGQKMGIQGREFSGPVFRVKLSGNRLVEGDAVKLPSRVNIYDFAMFPGNSQQLAILDRSGHLSIVNYEGAVIASSIDPVGGNESYLEMNEDAQTGGESRASYFKSRIEVNSKGEIVVPVNGGFTMLSRAKIYTKSEIKAFKWDGATLKEVWHTNQEKSYLADFRFSDAANTGKPGLITAVAFQTLNPFASRKSVLHIYTLQ